MTIHAGSLLTSMRKHRKKTMLQMAVLLGKSKGNVSQLEKQAFCTTRILDEWAKALNFSLEITVQPNDMPKEMPDNFL